MLESNGIETDFEDLLESQDEGDFEDFGSPETLWERSGRRVPPRPLSTPRQGNAMVKLARAGFATKRELDETAKRLDGRIATNSNAIKALDRRTHSLQGEVGRIGMGLKKEIEARKKETAELKRSVDEARQIAMILPLISESIPGTPIGKVLPILLYSGGFGGFGGGGGTGTGTDNNGMMVAALALAFMKT